MKWIQTIAMVGMLAAAIPGGASTIPSSVIQADEVTAAFRDRKIEITPSQIQFFTDVPMLQPSSLDVWTIERAVNGRSLAKIRCHDRAACIPFYVAVRWANAKQQALALEVVKPERPPAAQKRVVEPLVIHAGEPATLLISGDQMQLQMQVQCLDSGRAGSKIRVRNKDTKKIYRAEVIGPNSVRINM